MVSRRDVLAGVVAAAASGALFLLGTGTGAHNAALAFPADGGPAVEYDKIHLIPGLEDALAAGDRPVLLDGRRGLAICKDLDFPGTVRDYRATGATALLVPALDFDRDAWLHSRMAVLRGVESGLPVVRAGRAGAVTVSDAYGRVLVEDRDTGRPGSSAVTATPAAAPATPYALLGDWFAWLCIAACGLVSVFHGYNHEKHSRARRAHLSGSPDPTRRGSGPAGPVGGRRAGS